MMSAFRFAGFLNKHTQPRIQRPNLGYSLNMQQVMLFICFLRQRGCSKATLAEQVDVAVKVVSWLIYDTTVPPQERLPAGTTVEAATVHLQLLRRLYRQIQANLPAKPRRPLPELVTPEHLAALVFDAMEEAERIISSGFLTDLGVPAAYRIRAAERVMTVCLACMFWGSLPPLRPSGMAGGSLSAPAK